MRLSFKDPHIKELKELFDSLPPLTHEQKDILDKKFRLEFNFNSNHIEGNTLTYADTEMLLIFDETRGGHTHREYEEMKASDVAYEMISQFAKEKERPLTEAFIKNLNEVLLVRPYWKDAITADGQKTRRQISVGNYKIHSNSVILDNGEIFEYALPLDTPNLMAELIKWYREQEEKGELSIEELAAIFHYRFVRIHPFDDGNGRISRLLMNYVLLKNNCPPVVIKSKDKRNYLSALRDADTGNIESFVQYITNQIIWSFELSIKAAKNESISEEEDWKKKLHVIKSRLADKETISLVKSNQIICKLLNEIVFPFMQDLQKKLVDFDSLFLHRKIYLIYNLREGKIGEINESLKITEAQARDFFSNNCFCRLSFEEFTKSVENPFSVDVEIRFKFYKHKYEVLINETLLLVKLYHQKLDKDVSDVLNKIGDFVTNAVEKQI